MFLCVFCVLKCNDWKTHRTFRSSCLSLVARAMCRSNNNTLLLLHCSYWYWIQPIVIQNTRYSIPLPYTIHLHSIIYRLCRLIKQAKNEKRFVACTYNATKYKTTGNKFKLYIEDTSRASLTYSFRNVILLGDTVLSICTLFWTQNWMKVTGSLLLLRFDRWM